ncbi:hypothetical protein Hanom_Chr08g00736141 [Helianthus anomalus]
MSGKPTSEYPRHTMTTRLKNIIKLPKSLLYSNSRLIYLNQTEQVPHNITLKPTQTNSHKTPPCLH